jgi:hypothetical protein
MQYYGNMNEENGIVHKIKADFYLQNLDVFPEAWTPMG